MRKIASNQSRMDSVLLSRIVPGRRVDMEGLSVSAGETLAAAGEFRPHLGFQVV